MSADPVLHARKTAEARLHDADYMNGEPLDIGDGYSVAFHSADCRYCAHLKEYADKTLSWEPLQGTWVITKAN